MRFHRSSCLCLVLACAILHPALAGGRDPSRYRSDAVLRGYYWEGYATAFREEMVDLASGSPAVVNRGTARTERERAWFAGYRDGVREASQLAQEIYERQVKEAQRTRGSK